MKLLPFLLITFVTPIAFAASPAPTPASAEKEIRHLNIAEVVPEA